MSARKQRISSVKFLRETKPSNSQEQIRQLAARAAICSDIKFGTNDLPDSIYRLAGVERPTKEEVKEANGELLLRPLLETKER